VREAINKLNGKEWKVKVQKGPKAKWAHPGPKGTWGTKGNGDQGKNGNQGVHGLTED